MKTKEQKKMLGKVSHVILDALKGRIFNDIEEPALQERCLEVI